MKEFTMNNKVVNLPENWLEIKWTQFFEFTKLVNKYDNSNEEIVEEDKDISEYKETLRQLEFNTEVLAFWTGLTKEEIGHWDMKQAEEILACMAFINQQYVPININSFTIGEEKFLLPKDLMRESSFGRYIEAEQLEIQSNLIEGGKIEYMPRQIAILCKKEGESEKLDDDLIDKRAKLFETLDMATIWDVAFFLNKLEQGLLSSFLTSQAVVMQKQKEQQKEL